MLSPTLFKQLREDAEALTKERQAESKSKKESVSNPTMGELVELLKK